MGDIIYIRPNISDIEEATKICLEYPELETHIGMMGAHNFIIIMHDDTIKCLACNPTDKDADIIF